MDDAPTPKRRWYRITPERLVILLLAFEAYLLLSQWQCCYPFRGSRGWGSLASVAAVALTLLLLSAWFFTSLIFRWRFQYSLRSLLLLFVVVAIAFSWLATELQRAGRQRDAVGEAVAMGARVEYELSPVFLTQRVPFDFSTMPFADFSNAPSYPGWLRTLFGDDFFGKAVGISVDSDAQLKSLRASDGLTAISLWGGSVTDAAIANLERFPQLQTLGICYAKVTDKGLHGLRALSQLRRLQLRETRVTAAGLKHVGHLHQLVWLDLCDIRNVESGLIHLRELRRLEGLLLSDADITDSELALLKHWPQLECLCLDGTKITDRGVEHVGHLSHLVYLGLTHTKITDAGLVYLEPLTKLRRLQLDGTAVTEDGMKKLKCALPDCQIRSDFLRPKANTVHGPGMMPPPP
jgi:hypothetical protein